MTAFRWLSGGAWDAATLTGTTVEGGDLVLPAAGSPTARHGVAVIAAGAPAPAQRESSTDDRWRRVVLRLGAPVPPACWVRVWTLVAAPGVVPGVPDALIDADDRAPLPAVAGRWRAAALDALDVRVLCPDAGQLWVAVELGGDGTASPRVTDVRVETGDDGPVTQLPVAYRGDVLDRSVPVDDGDGVLGRYLGLLGGELEQLASVVDELPALFSVEVAPDRADSSWVERLATWVALEPARLPSGDAGRRESVATAVERHGWRGTRRGLVDQVRRETGLTVEVVEPLASAAVWRLDGVAATSALGMSTGLVAADPGPPALDRTAYLDASMLVSATEAGLPVHAHLAHRICVHVPDGTPAQVASVDVVVQRERPAHVLARTCAVSHTTGVPTVVGIDALPPEGPPGLAGGEAFSPDVDGPGARIGTVRLPPGLPEVHDHDSSPTPAAAGAPSTKPDPEPTGDRP